MTVSPHLPSSPDSHEIGEFAGKTVIVTGAGSGIGRATARAFATAGADVLAVGRTKSRLTETATDHPSIRPYAADISTPDAPEKIVTTALATHGRIDVLVNNAGIIGSAPLGEITRDVTTRIMNTNVYAPIFLTQEALPHLESANGTVINLSTAIGHGLRGWPGNSIYGASKVALEFLTRTWAVELAPRGVRVAAVAPGVINTPILENNDVPTAFHEEAARKARNFTPLGRIGTPPEVAWWIVNIAHPQASFATGFVLSVDGGASIGSGETL